MLRLQEIELSSDNLFPSNFISKTQSQTERKGKAIGLKSGLPFMRKLDSIILMHLANEGLTIQQICEELELSPTQVYRKVKSLTGMTPFQYLQSLRLDHAQSLLKTTSMNTSEIASIVGFKELSSFSNVFKKEYGMTPTVMRKAA